MQCPQDKVEQESMESKRKLPTRTGRRFNSGRQGPIARCLFLGLCGIALTTSSTAQESQIPPSTQTPSVLAQESGQGDINSRIQALIEVTEKAREARQVLAGDSAPVPPVSSSEIPASIQPQVDASKQMSEIRERLKILQQFRRDRSMPSAPQSLMPPAETTWPPETPPGPVPQGTAIAPNVKGNPELDQQVAPALESDNGSTAGTATGTSPTSPSPDSQVAGERILPGAVDSFALGESLYRTGNYQSALTALASADTSGMSQSERTWLDLMTAMCQRKTGDYDQAEGMFRDIANAKSSDFPVQIAKWWVKYAESSHQSKQKFETLESEIELLMERSRSYVEH